MGGGLSGVMGREEGGWFKRILVSQTLAMRE